MDAGSPFFATKLSDTELSPIILLTLHASTSKRTSAHQTLRKNFRLRLPDKSFCISQISNMRHTSIGFLYLVSFCIFAISSGDAHRPTVVLFLTLEDYAVGKLSSTDIQMELVAFFNFRFKHFAIGKLN